MREATIFRKKIRINEKDFKRILNRFNVTKYKMQPNEIGGIIKISCPLCKKHHNCDDCQFGVFEYECHEGCMKVILSIIKNLDNIWLQDHFIEYDNENGKKKIQKIHNFIMTRFRMI